MSPAARAATLTVRRSTRFVTWVRSWRAGLVPYDEVAPEIAEDEEHLAADAPGTWTEVPLGEILSMFAKLHPDEIRVVLPVPVTVVGRLTGDAGVRLLDGEGRERSLRGWDHFA